MRLFIIIFLLFFNQTFTMKNLEKHTDVLIRTKKLPLEIQEQISYFLEPRKYSKTLNSYIDTKKRTLTSFFKIRDFSIWFSSYKTSLNYRLLTADQIDLVERFNGIVESGPNEKKIAIVGNNLVNLEHEEQQVIMPIVPNCLVPRIFKLPNNSQYNLHPTKPFVLESKPVGNTFEHSIIALVEKQGCFFKYNEKVKSQSFYSSFLPDKNQRLAVQFLNDTTVLLGGESTGKKFALDAVNCTSGTYLGSIDLTDLFKIYSIDLSGFQLYCSLHHPNAIFINGYDRSANTTHFLIYSVANGHHELLASLKGHQHICPDDPLVMDLIPKKIGNQSDILLMHIEPREPFKPYKLNEISLTIRAREWLKQRKKNFPEGQAILTDLKNKDVIKNKYWLLWATKIDNRTNPFKRIHELLKGRN